MTDESKSAQYDRIAQQYGDSKQSDVVTYIESPTFFGMLGDVTGLAVLDLACGDGFYTRQLKDRGAARVVGVDVSAEMIALAEKQESLESKGIEYLCADVATLPDLGAFDVVTAAFLLHYSGPKSPLQNS